MLAREIPHKGGRTYGYRISDGRSTLTYMPDHCPTAFGEGPDGCGEYHPAALELAAGADLLVHDAQLLARRARRRRPLRTRLRRVRGRARPARAGPRAWSSSTTRPDRTDEALDELARPLSTASPGVSIAVQGAVLEL